MVFFSKLLHSVYGCISREFAARRRHQGLHAPEFLEVKALLSVSFQLNYIPSSPAGIGFDHPTLGAARRAALETAATQYGQMFSQTAVITLEVSSTEDAASDTLASAGSNNSDQGAGFLTEVMRTKVLTGVDNNGLAADGTVSVNWGAEWQISQNTYDTTSLEYDFVAAIRHELTHAMGFSSSIQQDGSDTFDEPPGTAGSWSFFDSFLTDAAGNPVINPTTNVINESLWNTLSVGGSSAEGVGLFFNGPRAVAANAGVPVGLFSPTTWENGSSGSHMDDQNPNLNYSMMFPARDFGPETRNFSGLERAILEDLGYELTALPKQDVAAWDSTTGDFSIGASTGTRFPIKQGPNWAPGENWQFVQGDFNNDGKLDVAGLNAAGTWRVGLSDGTTFTTSNWGTLTTESGWQDIQVGDFDNDGDQDILARSSTGRWWLSRSSGSAFTVTALVRWAPTGWKAIVSGDFNEDGKLDVAGLTNSGQWWVGVSDGVKITNAPWVKWSSSAGWKDVSVGDFNGDGKADVAARSSAGHWWIGQSTGTAFQNVFGVKWDESLGWQDIKIGDFDGDNRADIAGRTSTNTWYVARSNGTSLSNKIWTQWNSSVNWKTAVADFDGDGRDDIAGYISTSQSWWVALANPSLTFNNAYFGPGGLNLTNVGFIGAGQVVI